MAHRVGQRRVPPVVGMVLQIVVVNHFWIHPSTIGYCTVLLDLVLRQFAASAHARIVTSPLPRALDEPIMLSGAAEPVRVLLVGSGVTSGWGVRTHGLGLAGAIQRSLQVQLRHPVDVEQVDEVGAESSTPRA